jgi:hypothetical protein
MRVLVTGAAGQRGCDPGQVAPVERCDAMYFTSGAWTDAITSGEYREHKGLG